MPKDMNGKFPEGETYVSNAYIKSCSSPLVIREMHAKVMRYHFMSIGKKL